MSFLGSLFGDSAPNEKYVDDQTMQEDHRNDKFVGAAIDTACNVYDTMFDALKFVIRGKADVLEKMDKMVSKLEKKCKAIADKYQEILKNLNDSGADFSAGMNLDIARDAFDLLDSNPILRRYVGEANYWVLWDTLATLSSQGASISADLMSNLKGAIKGTIYALLSMTNGLMRYESYITQLTQFWGWLYAKEIWLPLTDSICPQVTCAYFYKPEDNGQFPDSSNSGLDKYNPIPGSGNFAPMPIPVFDYEHNSVQKIASHFSYDDPTTWDVLTPKSRAAFQKAYKYWRSNYTNATSVNELLSAASSKLTGGAFTAGFGRRKHNHPLGTPLRVGHTFSQLYVQKNESFPVTSYDDPLMEAFANVDAAFAALLTKMEDPETTEKRDTLLAENQEGAAEFIGSWTYTGHGIVTYIPPEVLAAYDICEDVATSLPEFTAFCNAITALSSAYNEQFPTPYNDDLVGNWGRPYTSDAWQSPPLGYLVEFLKKIQEEAPTEEMSALLDTYEKDDPELGLPYAFYTNKASERLSEIYEYVAEYLAKNPAAPLYTAATNILSMAIDVDAEIGRKIDRGRQPMFAAIGVYGDLKGLYPWNYEVVPYESFLKKYKRIKNSYHVYYNENNPSEIIFADNIIRVGVLKYIATSKAVHKETMSRGSESYTVHIFPSETCSVYVVPPPSQAFGVDFPSLASLQRVDAESPDGVQYMYSLATNAIPRWPKYVDPEKWSVMDLIHELWLLADSLTPLCGDGGKRRAELDDLLNQFGIVADGPGNGAHFIGQLPGDDGQNVRMEFKAMNEFASRLKDAIDTVYNLRDELVTATQNW